MKTKEELAYIAGFIDGEGYIGIKKYIRNSTKTWCPMYSEKISVAGTCEPVIKSFDTIIKGYINFHKHSKLSKRGYWSWEVTENKARLFLQMIYPYLKVKKLEADILLLLGKNKKKTKSNTIKEEDRMLREKLYLQIKELHTFKEVA